MQINGFKHFLGCAQSQPAPFKYFAAMVCAVINWCYCSEISGYCGLIADGSGGVKVDEEKAAIKRLVLWADATTGMVGFIL